MPNIYLKNEIGEDIAYENIDTLTVRRVEGGTATYTFGNPQATDAWNMVESFVSTSYQVSGYSSPRMCITDTGRLVASDAPNFGTWFQSRNDAWRVSNGVFNIGVQTVFGAVLSLNSNSYIWDDTNNTLTAVEGIGSFSATTSVQRLSDKYVIFGSRGIGTIDAGTLQSSIIYSYSGSYSGSIYTLKVPDGVLFSQASNSLSSLMGIYFIDETTFEVTKKFDTGFSWLGKARYWDQPLYESNNATCIQDVPNGFLITSLSSGSTYPQNLGVLFYDSINKIITRMCSGGMNLLREESMYNRHIYGTSAYSHIMDGYGVLIGGNNSNSGAYYYDYESKTVTQVDSAHCYYNYIERDDLVLGSYSSYGAIVFDKNTKTWYHPVTTGTYDNALILEDGILLGASSSGTNGGLKYYSFTTGNVTTLNTTYGQWRSMEKVIGGAIVASHTNSSGIWYFDESNISLTSIYSGSGVWWMSENSGSVLLCDRSNGLNHPKLYKSGSLIDIVPPGSQTYMQCMAPVDDGWIVSINGSSSNRMWFVSISNASAVYAGPDQCVGCMIGQPGASWYDFISYRKPTRSFNSRYGKYSILTSYTSNYQTGIIWDNVNKSVVPIHWWYENQDTPSPTSVVYSMYYLANIYLVDIDENIVLMVNGYTSASYTTILNYDTGVAYIFNINCSSENETTNTYAPCLVEKNVSDGKIFFFKKTAYPISSASWNCSAGIFHYNKNNMRIQRLKSSGYYNTTEDAPGGFYIYTSMYPDLDRCYWNNETNTLTEIPY